MSDDWEDIDLSEANIHNFIYCQGMRATRARELYQLCINNIIPYPCPLVFGDEFDRDKVALRRFRNDLCMDQVPNIQFAYQQCGLKDDGQGMTSEELENLKKMSEMSEMSLTEEGVARAQENKQESSGSSKLKYPRGQNKASDGFASKGNDTDSESFVYPQHVPEGEYYGADV
ncbi:hypothetical protein BDZ91DRAFT_762616 [Kalaharituber pfeilii]|nr:hypothetical protein BDZ91DRAFT_762616 [Kalaharituber pfeilii]